MARLDRQFTCDYLDTEGDDPAADWVVIRDDYADLEAAFPVTRLPALIDTLPGEDADLDPDVEDMEIVGESFLGSRPQNVVVPGPLLPALRDVLVYFNKGATAGSRPPLVVQVFDSTEEMLAALGMDPK